MNTIEKIQERNPMYRLDNGISQATICPDRGGMVTSFVAKGRDVLWLAENALEDPTMTVQGGIPVLFPICSVLPDDLYYVDGKDYRLPLHGFARLLPWKVTDDRGAMTVSLASSGLTKALYPFDFELSATYALVDTRLEISLACLNHSMKPMPVQFGFHPFLNVSSKGPDLLFDTDGLSYYDLVTQETHELSRSMDLREDHGGKLISNVTYFAVTDPLDRCKITLTQSPEFTEILLWSGEEKRYCVEPWSAGMNAMNSGENLIWIKPNECRHAWCMLEASFLEK